MYKLIGSFEAASQVLPLLLMLPLGVFIPLVIALTLSIIAKNEYYTHFFIATANTIANRGSVNGTLKLYNDVNMVMTGTECFTNITKGHTE